MFINLENKYLVPAIDFMQGLKLKAADSRARSKFVKLLTAAVEDLQESESALIKEYAECDSDGNPISEDGGETFKIKTGKVLKEFTEQQSILVSEVAIINLNTYKTHVDRLTDILESYDGELSGHDAEVYDRLLDALDEVSMKGGDK